MFQLYIGTSGWSYKDWVGRFYPRAQSKNFDYLKYYADFFNSVEVNVSYYSYLKPETADTWIEKLKDKDDFLFTVKLHNDFTHEYKFDRERIEDVKTILSILNDADRLGGLLIQFPYSFVLNHDNAYHVKNIIDAFGEYEKFIEVRHKSWYIDRFFNFLQQNKSSLCTIDQPNIGESVGFNDKIDTANSYIRLHGRNEKGWLESINKFNTKQTFEQKSERYNYLYTPAEITDLGIKIKEIAQRIKKIFIFFNNHPKGSSVANALELKNYLKDNSGVKIPETTLQAYPRLSKLVSN